VLESVVLEAANPVGALAVVVQLNPFRRFLWEAVCGLFEALSITVSVPLAEPAEDG
jgi:hypothetical protein